MRLPPVAIACLLLGAAIPAPIEAQQYVISTYAGAARPPSLNTSLSIGQITADALGNVYLVGYPSDNTCTCVFKLDANGILTRVAGSAQRGFSGDGGPATKAQLSSPTGLAADRAGNLFIVDQDWFHGGSFPTGSGADRVRRVSPDGIITTIAGGGSLAGAAADGGPATSAKLYYPTLAAVDAEGNLFFSESLDAEGEGSNRIRKVTPDGIISTVAGNGMFGFSGDGGPATSAQLKNPVSLAVDEGGNLFFADVGNQRIRKVTPDGIISTVVDLSASFSQSCYCSVTALALDRAGNLFFLDYGRQQIRKVSPGGTITTVADTSLAGWGLAIDDAGSVLFNTGSNLRKISADGSISILLGSGACCYSGDGGPANSAQLNHTRGVAADAAGNLFLADTDNHRLRKVTRDGIISTVAGNGLSSITCDALSGDSGPAAAAQLCNPSQVAVDGAGNVFIVDGNRIRKVSPSGIITPFAGNGAGGFDGDGGLASEAELNYPNSVAADGSGNVYVAEWARVRKISPDGVITTVAGNGTRPSNSPAPAGDGGPAILAQLWGPASVSVDGGGNIYFVDGQRVRKVSLDGIITTVAGNNGSTGYHGYTGDGGPAVSAPLWAPNGVAADKAGNLFISEPARIRMVTTDGIIRTVAGNGEPGYSGDGGPATRAQLWNPTGVAVDGAGNVYVADSFNNVIRVLRSSPF